MINHSNSSVEITIILVDSCLSSCDLDDCLIGKGVTTEDRTALSRAKPTSSVSSSAHVKPFAGKVFYLDLPSNKTTETLESDIKELGGVRQKHIWL